MLSVSASRPDILASDSTATGRFRMFWSLPGDVPSPRMDVTLGDITDALFLLLHLFLGDVTPPAPFPDCGTSNDGTSTCDAYDACD